jgi:hypothetical protein
MEHMQIRKAAPPRFLRLAAKLRERHCACLPAVYGVYGLVYRIYEQFNVHRSGSELAEEDGVENVTVKGVGYDATVDSVDPFLLLLLGRGR